MRSVSSSSGLYKESDQKFSFEFIIMLMDFLMQGLFV